MRRTTNLRTCTHRHTHAHVRTRARTYSVLRLRHRRSSAPQHAHGASPGSSWQPHLSLLSLLRRRKRVCLWPPRLLRISHRLHGHSLLPTTQVSTLARTASSSPKHCRGPMVTCHRTPCFWFCDRRQGIHSPMCGVRGRNGTCARDCTSGIHT